MIDLNLNPKDRDLRLFGGLWLPIFLCLVAWFLDRREILGVLPAVLLGAAALSICIALPRPAWIRPVWFVLMVAAFPIGFVVSHVVLGLVYYAVVTPMGLVMRMVGRDPLKRQPDPAATTYWLQREPQTDTNRYFRQF